MSETALTDRGARSWSWLIRAWRVVRGQTIKYLKSLAAQRASRSPDSNDDAKAMMANKQQVAKLTVILARTISAQTEKSNNEGAFGRIPDGRT